MAITNAAQAAVKTVADPNASYDSLKSLWVKCKAVCSGERFVKDLDVIANIHNLLIPFSPSMTQDQYNLYKAEAELPGITAQFSKMLIGGLLRKSPSLKLPASVPEEAHGWIINEFSQDDSTLISFMDDALWEEIRTSRCWVYIDHPEVLDPDILSTEELAELKPFPVIWDAESVINWHVAKDKNGKDLLTKVIVRGFTEDYTNNEFHPELVDTVWVHELLDGLYQVRVFKKEASEMSVPVIAGVIQQNNEKATFKLVNTFENIEVMGERLRFIPAWPLNGSINPVTPVLSTIIDKEISLYNKISRRNHLLYGAATYTPYIASEMSDEAFESIVEAGLGSWLHIGKEDKAGVLSTPTEALADMDRAIASGIEEIAKLGIRMLSPETEQSGVALQLRNAAQTAQLGTLNSKISATLKQIIAFMIGYRYGVAIKPQEIDFSLSADFNPMPLGADWLRLATEWYESGYIPRTVWLLILKQNDIISPDYDDEEGQKEINNDDLLIPKGNEDYLGDLQKQTKV
jgi:hypothetical protein